MAAAAAAYRKSPGEAGEPGVLGRRLADGDRPDGLVETAEFEFEPRRVGAPVDVAPFDRDSLFVAGDRLATNQAE